MYYPMRVVRGERWKLIWNIAHELPYPHASDLWASSTWQAQHEQGPDASYGSWTVHRYTHRPEFELYDVRHDPWETNNLAASSEHRDVLKRLKQKLKDFQKRTNDPWQVKWRHE
jgi:N-sulfoglucosamine sulfohydrolase